MRTWWLLSAGIAGLALLVAPVGGVLAQSGDAPAAWIEATNTEFPCVGSAPPDEFSEGLFVERLRGSHLECAMDLGDPRLKGTADMTWNYDCYDPDGCVRWGSLELTGQDGTWVGTFRGVESRVGSGATFSADYMELVGEGAYAGLAYMGQAANQFSSGGQFFGIVFEGDLPPHAAE